MKNNKWLLGVIIILSSCSNDMQQIEDSSLNELAGESIATTSEENILQIQNDSISLFTADNSNEPILYPAMSFSIDHESNYVHDEVVINVPRLGREYVYNTEGKHANLPKYNLNINTHCQIQYRVHALINGFKHHPWYEYHPDTILCTTPYTLEVPNYHPDDYRLLKVRLNAARLPKAPFDIRGILVGGGTRTEQLPDNWSYDPWEFNYNGFENNHQDNDNPNRQIVDVRAQLSFSVTIYIERDMSGIYELRFGNQIVRKPYTKGESLITHTFTEDVFFKAYLNSHYTITREFEGRNYDFNFYIAPEYRGGMLYASAEAYKYH